MARTSHARSIRTLFFVIAAAAALLLPSDAHRRLDRLGPRAGAGEQPKYGGIIRLAEREPPNLDPHLSISFMPQNIGSLVYSSLVRFPYGHEQKNPYDLTIMPDLAERWEYLDDKTVVFYLRKGVKFHNKPPVNGRELKAQDVKYSLERFATKSGFRARFDDVERVEVVDDYTVKDRHQTSLCAAAGPTRQPVAQYDPAEGSGGPVWRLQQSGGSHRHGTLHPGTL